MPAKKPNILILWGDDIGIWNISHFSRGAMGYRTPNIDRIAEEGATFTDYYAQQSCTAGRASFICGQNPIRTGLTKVGMPGATVGLQKEDPTIAELLKPLGYATGQFGKNHLGDRNEYLPTVHGFDEFFGNLYHLNAEEEPELPDYPKDPAFKKKFGPRGVLHCKATDKDDATVDQRFGRVGKQTIEDTGPLTKKRMETIDEEITARAHRRGWKSRPRPTSRSSSGTTPPRCTSGRTSPRRTSARAARTPTATAWSCTTSRSARSSTSSTSSASPTTPSSCTRPTTARRTTPGRMAPTRRYRGQKDTNWEGGWRVPSFTSLARQDQGRLGPERHRLAHRHVADAAGGCRATPTDHGAAADGLQGRRQKTYKVHLDGYNMLPYLTGEVKESPRNHSSTSAMTATSWPCGSATISSTSRSSARTTMEQWAEPFVKLRCRTS